MEIVTADIQPVPSVELRNNPWHNQEQLEAPQSYFLNSERQQTVTSLIARFHKERREKDIPSDLVLWNDLEEMLLPEEMEVIRYLNRISPREIGFYGPRVEDDGDGRDLVEINNQIYLDNEGVMKTLPTKFIPKPVKEKIDLLNEWLEVENLEPLLIESGYRSPAYQAILFLKFLSKNEFDIEKTANRVALPGYSEHGSLQIGRAHV